MTPDVNGHSGVAQDYIQVQADKLALASFIKVLLNDL